MGLKIGISYTKLMKEKEHYVSEVFDWYTHLDHSNPDIKKHLEKNETLSKILKNETLTHELLLRLDENNNLNTEPILKYTLGVVVDEFTLDEKNDLRYGSYRNVQYGSRLTSQQIAKNKNGSFLETKDITDKFTDVEFLNTINEFNRKLKEELHRGNAINEIYPIGPDNKQYRVFIGSA